jgi:soluble lytic murein transglycosylase-like protein
MNAGRKHRTWRPPHPAPSPFSLPALAALAQRVPAAACAITTVALLSTGLTLPTVAFASPADAAHADDPAAVARATGDRFGAFIAEAAQRFGIPTAWIRAVIAAESAGNPFAISPKGAAGLMQIMPQSWQALRARFALGDDPFDPHDNITAGTGYLRELYDRYGSPGFLAAYNAGAARWDEYARAGAPLPDETRRYLVRLDPVVTAASHVGAVLPDSAIGGWEAAALFADGPASASERHVFPVVDRQRAETPQQLAPQSGSLFVALGSGRRQE